MLVTATRPLGYDALKIVSACQPEEVVAISVYVIYVPHPLLHSGHDARQSALTFQKRHSTHLPMNAQDIEGTEERLCAMKQEVVEVAPAVVIEAHDLTIEDRRLRSQGVGKFELQRVPTTKVVAVPTHQATVPAFNNSECPEAI
jgi:hypothetical protein